MKKELNEYQTLIFDCDGVILNSNKVKTEAFYNSVVSYGRDGAQALVNYHIEYGGVSRFKKFDYFFEHILGRKASELEFNAVLEKYAEEVRRGLLSCDIAEGLSELRELTTESTWLVASGGAQEELRDIFDKRDLTKFFAGGIYGSPTAKDIIVEQQLLADNIQLPALFIGDSRFDHIVAKQFDLDFLFVTDWSEFVSLSDYAESNKLLCLPNIKSLCRFNS
ncbi:HAD hydrolase-like protein [Alteromonas sp. 345S023]|uniref:HAD hydrolase-like protein n=1 Tax=Alteromonas profundi TaxID=2696062 RepID=A0A7X5LML7_9ALTE|nr:HAD hydrolase-like protein [Alteromonas profundi]NDV91699.1 HAD hydrolase-like protein [Alteromonas profundi]